VAQNLSTQWDRTLGGRDFDGAIAAWAAGQFNSKYASKGVSDPMLNDKARYKLHSAAEKAKKTLSPSGVKEARINIECLVEDFDFSGILKVDEFEALIAPLLDRLEAPIARALAEANIGNSDIESVQIVGGGSRVASVKRRLAKVSFFYFFFTFVKVFRGYAIAIACKLLTPSTLHPTPPIPRSSTSTPTPPTPAAEQP